MSGENSTTKKRIEPEKNPALKCSVCGAFKFQHEDYCRECQEYRDHAMARKRQAARSKQWGGIW